MNSGSKPSWSTHNSGFTAVVDIIEEAYGWGTTSKKGIVLTNDQMFINDSNKPPVGYEQMGNSSIPVWWLRGGGIYFLAADYDCTWTIRKSKYENISQSVEPKTTYPGVNISKSTIKADLDGTAFYASSAAKLDTATAGSTTQPVYFSGGKPVAIGYTIAKSVPADANFTNTWRGIQNNLTSTATDQSLSAAQGKILKDALDKKTGVSVSGTTVVFG